MKHTFKRFLDGATVAFGVQVGFEAFNKLKNPVTRTNLKRRLQKIKDAVFSKEES